MIPVLTCDEALAELDRAGVTFDITDDGAEAVCPVCLHLMAWQHVQGTWACTGGCDPSRIGDELHIRSQRHAEADEPVAAHPRTDLSNAELFAELYAHRLRYARERRTWLHYNGGRWQPDRTGEPERASKDVARRLLAIAAECEDGDERGKAAKWAATSQGEPRLRAMLTLAATEPGIAIADSDLDRDPFALALADVTVDLRTGRTFEPNPGDLITRASPVTYRPNARCPRWERFLLEIFDGDLELIRFVQRLIGYCLTGDTREHVLAVLYGVGGNGKSTFLEIVKGLLGDLAVTAAFDTFTRARGDRGPRNDLARLRGARVVTASESGEGRRLDEATVKEITGGDTIAARFLYGEHFEFKPEFKLLLAANHKPRVDGDDDAIWRRLRLIPFEQNFEGREDHDLIDTLRGELAGILNWAIEGCIAWQNDGLGAAAAVTHATRAYRADEDQLGAFLADRMHPGGEIGAVELRGAYEQWCEENGERPLAGNALGRRLVHRGINAERRTAGRRVYVGLSLGPVTDDGSDGRIGNSPRAGAYGEVQISPSPAVTAVTTAPGETETDRVPPRPDHVPDAVLLERADQLSADHPDLAETA